MFQCNFRISFLTLSIAISGGLASLSVPGAVYANPTSMPEPEASRPPEKDCVWKPYESRKLGIRLLFQDCSAPDAHYVLKENGDWLEQHRPANDTIFGSHQIIWVLSKPADQSIEEAIKKTFIDKLTFDDKNEQAQARKSCRVVKTPDFHLKDNGKVTLTLLPTGQYKKKIDRETQQYPRDFGCGPYGAGQGSAYFEYHPEQSKTKYLFVVYGMDEPLFDENSIEFMEK